MRALVTGADGFVGRWLVRHLVSVGDDVAAVGGPRSGSEWRMDVGDRADVERVFGSIRPDVVYHLAGVSHGPTASAAPADAVGVTVGGTANVVAVAAGLSRSPLVLLASSGEVYAPALSGLPVKETHAIDPPSLYGAVKASQELVATAIARANSIPLLTVRCFNQIGPEQREDFVVAAFAMQLATIANGDAEPRIRVGNLEARRDFVDVRDAVRAFRALVAGGETGVYNIATGRAIAVGTILERLMIISQVGAEVVVDPSRLRPVDRPFLAGDPRRTAEAVGWTATTSLQQSLADIWDDAVVRATFAGDP